MAAMLKILRTPYARSYLHPYLHLSVHPRGSRCTHMCISIWPKTLLHPTSMAKIINNTLRTYSAHNTMHPLTTFQVRVRHERRRTWSPRETTYLIASRDNVRDRPKRRRTWLPRETTYLIASRDDVRDRPEWQRTWSPRERTYAIAPRDDVQDSLRDGKAASERAWSPQSKCHRVRAGVVKWSELSKSWRAFVKASYSNCCNDTSKIVLVWNAVLLFH